MPLCSHQRVLIVNGGYPGSYLALAAIFAWAKRCVVFLNCHNLAPQQSHVIRLLEKPLDSAVARRVNLLLANSFATQTSLQSRFAPSAPACTTIYNAIESPPPATTTHMMDRKTDAAVVIGLVATLEPRKGHLFALQLLKKLNEATTAYRCTLRILGSDPYAFGAEIQKAISRLSLDGLVQIVGYRDKSDLYQGLDLVLVPSEVHESFGLVAIESLSRGIPVVASSVGALPEILNGSANASVVVGWNVDEWVEAVKERIHRSLSSGFDFGDPNLARFCNPDQMTSEYEQSMGIAGSS